MDIYRLSELCIYIVGEMWRMGPGLAKGVMEIEKGSEKVKRKEVSGSVEIVSEGESEWDGSV